MTSAITIGLAIAAAILALVSLIQSKEQNLLAWAVLLLALLAAAPVVF